jgi:tape measure domain-containing protein
MSDRIDYEIKVQDGFSSPLKALEQHLAAISKAMREVNKTFSLYNKEEENLNKKAKSKIKSLAAQRSKERKKLAEDRHNSFISRGKKQIIHLEGKQAKIHGKELETLASKFQIQNAKIRGNIEKSKFELAKMNTAISKRAGEVEKSKLELEKTKNTIAKQGLEQQKNFANTQKASGLAVKQGIASPVSLVDGKYQRAQPPAQPPQGGGGGRRPIMAGIGGGLGTMGGMARAMGYYELIHGASMIPRDIYGNLKEIRGIEASFDAFKKIGIAPDLKSPQEEIKDLFGIANKFGTNVSDIIDPYRKILATKKLSPDITKNLIGGMASYGNVVGMDASAQKATFLAFEQMLTKGKIQGQEFNLQLQQSPGMREMFFQAFLKAADEQGIPHLKKEVNRENVGERFQHYMERGLMESPILLKHLSDLLNEPELLKMGILKGHMVQGEENRVRTAYYGLTTSVGRRFEPEILAALKSIATSFNNFAIYIDNNGREIDIILKGLAETFKGIGSLMGLFRDSGKASAIGLNKMYEVKQEAKGREALEKIRRGESLSRNDENSLYTLSGKDFDEARSYLTNKLSQKSTALQQSRITDRSSREQVIKVILEGKNMDNIGARVENWGASSTKMRIESNLLEAGNY